MVLPSPAADPGAAQAPGWLDRLIRPLELTREGILLCLRDATPTQLGAVVRALSPSPPWAETGEVLEVCLRATEVLDVPPGSRVLLRVRVEDLDWLNIARPLFAERKLRTVLWADAAAHEGLVRRAVDFYDWVSRTVAVPAKTVPDFAVERMRAALAASAEIAWHGDGLVETFEAVGVDDIVEVHVEEPYLTLIRVFRGSRLPIVSGIRTERDIWRIRMALAEANRTEGWIAREPELSPGMRRLHARQLTWDDASAKLHEAGFRRPALKAASLNLEPERILATWRRARRATQAERRWMVNSKEPNEARLVRALRELGDELPSLELIDDVARSGFAETAASLALVRWNTTKDVDVERLIEWLIGDGDVDAARRVMHEWEALATTRDTRINVARWQKKLHVALPEVTQPSPPPEAADIELLQRWWAGDRGSGSVLVDRHYPALRTFFSNKVGKTDAADLIQETFERLLNTQQKTSGASTFRTYLFRIARNVLREDQNRRHQRHLLDKQDTDEIVDDGDTQESILAQDQELRLLLDALSCVPEQTREVVELRYFHGLSFEEIAQVLGVPVGTVRSRLSRALLHLGSSYRDLEQQPRTTDPVDLTAKLESIRDLLARDR